MALDVVGRDNLCAVLEHVFHSGFQGVQDFAAPAFGGKQGVKLMDPAKPVEPDEKEPAMFRPKRGDPCVSEEVGEINVIPKRDVRLDLGMLINATPKPLVSVFADQSNTSHHRCVPVPSLFASGAWGNGSRNGNATAHRPRRTGNPALPVSR
tara:strand:- start:137 stop:592 length:456 start_codon:yes stop_codon:yes gene_type:complete